MPFDPYHRWLGIPPNEQPPHHYRLLGIALLEADADVIRTAADRQTVHLRSFEAGEHSGLCQNLLQEVAAARDCLLNPADKAAYDRQLGERLQAATALPSCAVPAATPPAQRTQWTQRTPLWRSLGIVAVGVVVIVVILVRAWGVFDRPGPPSGAETAAVLPPQPKSPVTLTRAPSSPISNKTVLTNSIGMQFVLVPAGEFFMGSSSEELAWAIEQGKRDLPIEWYFNRVTNGTPRHRVKISQPFHLGAYEVTQGEYEGVMRVNPSTFSAKGPEAAKVLGQDTGRHPVDNVSWEDAVQFCRRLSELPKELAARRVYRLPTEAEWEYACRAGTTTKWSFGDDPAVLGEYAWCASNATGTTHPVGQKKPNAWGLHDMHGNVWEWCFDWFQEEYYRQSQPVDPTGPPAGAGRVLRGALWSDMALICRCAFRDCGDPGNRLRNVGFRVVCLTNTTELPPVLRDPTFDDWVQDFEAAKQKAAKEKKDILIVFDGSDWCGWSMKLAKEVFLRPEFRQQAEQNYVLVFVDFPQKAEAKAKVQDAGRNRKLAQYFEVYAYPTIVLTDAEGRPYGVQGFVHGGVGAFCERLAKWRNVKSKRDQAFADVKTIQDKAKLKAIRKAVAVLQDMDNLVEGIGLMRFYEATLGEWLEAAKKLDPQNADGDLEAIFATAWMARLAAVSQRDDKKQLADAVKQLDEWKKGFKFKDPDQAVILHLRTARLLMFAGLGSEAIRYIEEAKGYKPTNPALAWALEQATRSITEGFGHGTGFAVADGGYVLTNHHVIAGPGKLLVQLSPDPKDRVPAEVIGKDEKGDMALLKIETPQGRTLPPLAISAAAVRRGMKIGTFGYGGAGDVGTGIKLTQGIISSLPEKSTEGMMVLDCRVNPGNSGGPLCDTRGNVIGMVTAKSLSSEEFESYGMALPAENLKKFLARHLPKDHKAPEAELSEQTQEWDQIDKQVSGSVLKIVKGM